MDPEITTAHRRLAADIIKRLRRTFRRPDVARQLCLNPSYVSMIQNMNLTADGKYWAPRHAIEKVLAWGMMNENR